jgi:argininosuccinate lyase
MTAAAAPDGTDGTGGADEAGGAAVLWHGRFADGPDPALLALSVSIHFDRTLAEHDIRGSRAHVAGLHDAGIVDAAERAAIDHALDQVEAEIASGQAAFAPSDEDIHTFVERRVTELAGPAGGKLHTGRSRNDQVATDLRLFTRDQIDGVLAYVRDLARALLERADTAGDACLPGYTHLQRAQPVPLRHHLLAHGWTLLRDGDRLLDARRRVDVSPLGAGALAGSSLPLDPEATAARLGFAETFENSLDAVSDRDFVAEVLFDLALLGVHLSRIAEEVVLWSTDEFGFVRLPDAFATGSSMMPQKKNPDIGELVRGKSGRLIGDLTGLLATLKGLPLTYNRDLQEDKEPLFDAFDQTFRALSALAGLVRAVTYDTERMAAAAASPYLAATDLAEWLVERGMPFREAHAVVGALVRRSLDEGLELGDLVSEDEHLGPEAAELLLPGRALARRRTRGGAGPEAVAAQLERFRAALEVLDREANAAAEASDVVPDRR